MKQRNEIRADVNMAIKSMEFNREYECQDRYMVSLYIDTNSEVQYVEYKSLASELKRLC